MRTSKSIHDKFLESAERRTLYEQERLLVEATELLTEIMDKRGISRAQLAHKLGKSKAFITQVLRGNHNMTLRTLADLFAAIEYRLVMQAMPWQEAISRIPEFDYLNESSCYELALTAYTGLARMSIPGYLPPEAEKPRVKRTVPMDVFLSQGVAA